MDDELSLSDLAARTRQPEEELRRWIELGLLREQAGGGFLPEHIERVRFVQLLLRRGITLEEIARARDELDFRARRIARSGPWYSLEDAAEMAGIDLVRARRFWQLASPGDENEELDAEDVAALRGLKRTLDSGFPEEALFGVLRVYADTLTRAAEAGQRAFHFYVHERLVGGGMSRDEASEAGDSIAGPARMLTEPSVLYFLRKGGVKAGREDMTIHIMQDAGLAPPPDVPGRLSKAIVFVDLSSFTPLAEAMGDEKAADIVERFSLLVRDCVRRHEGQVVKQIGDAFMLVFPRAAIAVQCALDIEARTSAEPQFPASRSGIHWGEVLYREGDYVGANVNVASRVATEAERHQTLVTAAARREARDLRDVEFVPLGKRSLKGVPRETELFVARPVGHARAEKTIDPVCGMELVAEEVAARLTLEGAERCFCSDDCLRQFVAAPERYG